MNLYELRDYGNWIGKTAQEVYSSVRASGGWKPVFPDYLPIWASRIRQFFNITPSSIALLSEEQCERFNAISDDSIAMARFKNYSSWTLVSIASGQAFSDTIGTTRALSKKVYIDLIGKSVWFQMDAGSTIYHGPKISTSPTKDATIASLKGQAAAPVFKLVSLDDLGGSREVVLRNDGRGTIGAVHEVVKLASRLITDSVRQGSYNYGETIVMGLAEHERLDVRTDPMQPGYFVEPRQELQLSSRIFPANDSQGISLASQSEPASTSWRRMILREIPRKMSEIRR